MIEIKSPSELEIIRDNAKILEQVLREVVEEVAPGVTTLELDRLAEEYILEAGATPAFKNYRGFPNTLCTSINEEIVHGIPSDRQLVEGDILSLDIGLKKRGYYADFATTVPVGRVSRELEDLMEAGNRSLSAGLEQTRPGNRVSDISHAIEELVREKGYYVVKEFVGHGIGREMHEDPQIPNYGRGGQGKRIKEGMVFAVEPMLKCDDESVEVLDDGWTAVTAKGGPSVHFEGMVAADKEGPEVLVRGDYPF